jgi:hypothetical protein
VHCCFSDTGPVHEESVSLAGVRETFTKADLCPNAIGDGLRVADHVRCVGYSDRGRAPMTEQELPARRSPVRG